MEPFNLEARSFNCPYLNIYPFSQLTGLFSTKVVQLIGKIGSNEVFSANILEHDVAKNKKQFESMMNNHSFVPIAMKSLESKVAANNLQFNEIVFVKVNELAELGLKTNNAIRSLQNKDTDTGLKIFQVYNAIKSSLEGVVFFNQLKDSLIAKWSLPIDKSLLAFADDFVEEFRTFQLSENHHEKLILARAGGSHTIQNESQKWQNWSDADQFIKEKAQSREDLTIEDLSRINSLVVGLDDEDAGRFRDHPVTAGGRGGPSYISHKEVPLLLNSVLVELNEGIKTGENPIVLAAKAYQKIVSIHPFSDGNGRTCRLVLDYILLKADLPLPSFELDEVNKFGLFGDQICEVDFKENDLNIAVETLVFAMARTMRMGLFEDKLFDEN